MQLSNEFEVPAAPERTWSLLNDVPRVVPCMPGAELTRVVGENEWEATLRVKLGPISLQFLADVTREEVDEEARRVVLAAKAREAKNRGSADARLQSTVTAVDGGTRVEILTDLTLRGAVAQYGRGVVPEVASQLTKQFAACLQRQLAEEDEPACSPAEPASRPEPEPVRGLRLGIAALWRSLVGRLRGARSRALDRSAVARVVVTAGDGAVLVVRDQPPSLEDRAVGLDVRVHAEVDVAADDRLVPVDAAVADAGDPAERELLLLQLRDERPLHRREVGRLRLLHAARAAASGGDQHEQDRQDASQGVSTTFVASRLSKSR